MYSSGGRLVAGVEWLFGEVLSDVRFKPAEQRSSSIRPVSGRADGIDVVVDGMLSRTAGKSVRYAGEFCACWSRLKLVSLGDGVQTGQ